MINIYKNGHLFSHCDKVDVIEQEFDTLYDCTGIHHFWTGDEFYFYQYTTADYNIMFDGSNLYLTSKEG